MSDYFMSAYRANSLGEIQAAINEAIELAKAMPFGRDQLAMIWKLGEASGRLGVIVEGLQEETAR